MPLYGALALDRAVSRFPRMAKLDTEAWTLPGTEILQLAWEVGGDAARLLPRAMHPAIPPYAAVTVARFPDTRVGPFTLALLRLAGRAGAYSRGLALGGVATSESAARALRERWGLPVAHGEVTFLHCHDRAVARVSVDGETVLDAALVAPEVIAAADVQYIPSVTLAEVTEDGQARVRLVQVDPHYTFHKAERGRPHVDRFDANAWNAGGLALIDPISASFTIADTDLPQIRFVDPGRARHAPHPLMATTATRRALHTRSAISSASGTRSARRAWATLRARRSPPPSPRPAAWASSRRRIRLRRSCGPRSAACATSRTCRSASTSCSPPSVPPATRRSSSRIA